MSIPSELSTISGHSVFIKKYTTDGPGYVGSLLVHVGGKITEVAMPSIGDLDGNIAMKRVTRKVELPNIESVLRRADDFVQTVFDRLGTYSKEFCEKPEYVPDDFAVSVRWSDGSDGAILVWPGDPTIVSAIFFSGDLKGEITIDCDSLDQAEDFFVRPDQAASTLLLAGNELEEATTALRSTAKLFYDNDGTFLSDTEAKIACSQLDSRKSGDANGKSQ